MLMHPVNAIQEIRITGLDHDPPPGAIHLPNFLKCRIYFGVVKYSRLPLADLYRFNIIHVVSYT